jgi:hypothetical protein
MESRSNPGQQYHYNSKTGECIWAPGHGPKSDDISTTAMDAMGATEADSATLAMMATAGSSASACSEEPPSKARRTD